MPLWLAARRDSMSLAASLVVCFLFVVTNVQAEWVYQRQAIMGTDINLSLWHEDREKGEQAASAVMAEMHRIDKLLSPYKPTSELSILNRTAVLEPTLVSAELYALIDKSLFYSRVSEGAFDISFASLGQHYNYREQKKPRAEQLQALLPSIDYRQIKIDPASRSVFFANEYLQIDLGGIAKGYAVDQSIHILQDLGVQHATVSAGGDSRVLGDKRGKPWSVGIKNPRGKDEGHEAVALVLPMINGAISTSGDYERFFIDADTGERVHHIINPRTGVSVGGVASVSVLGPDGFDTDPLSTTVFVMGPIRGLALIEALPGFECIIIDRRGKVSYSSGLAAPAH